MEATRENFEAEEIPVRKPFFFFWSLLTISLLNVKLQFHRVRYFKILATGKIVWDRERRLDLITSNYSNPCPVNDLQSDILNPPHSSGSKLQGSSPDYIPSKLPAFSIKSKKNYLKRRRKNYLQKTLNEAREQLAEEIRIEEEHVKQYEDRMREVFFLKKIHL